MKNNLKFESRKKRIRICHSEIKEISRFKCKNWSRPHRVRKWIGRTHSVWIERAARRWEVRWVARPVLRASPLRESRPGPALKEKVTERPSRIVHKWSFRSSRARVQVTARLLSRAQLTRPTQVRAVPSRPPWHIHIAVVKDASSMRKRADVQPQARAEVVQVQIKCLWQPSRR